MSKPRLFGFFAPLLALVMVTSVAAQDATPGATPVAAPDCGDAGNVYEIPGEEVYPEGIALDEANCVFYVSSTTDGTIFRGDLASGVVEPFLAGGEDGRTSAVGLALDQSGRLYVAGGGTGSVFVYDTATGDWLGTLSNGLGEEETFINDLAFSLGSVFVTDSINPVLYAIDTTQFDPPVADPEATPAATPAPYVPVEGELTPYIEYADTPITYEDGFNMNGVAASSGGNYLVLVQSNTGQLFRVNVASGEVIEIDLGGASVENGDGVEMDGDILYVVRNSDEEIDQIDLSFDFSTGEIINTVSDESLNFPTTMALVQSNNTALVVNSQFDAQESGEPELPFTVVQIELPSPFGAGGDTTPEATPA